MESAPVVHIYWHFDITSELSEWVWKEPTDLNPIADPGWRHIETLNVSVSTIPFTAIQSFNTVSPSDEHKIYNRPRSSDGNQGQRLRPDIQH
jgi:hypothetical protein